MLKNKKAKDAPKRKWNDKNPNAKKGTFRGRMPKILDALTPEEIMQAGEQGYDKHTFLMSKGMLDASLRASTMTFPKFNDNYEIGKAKYLLRLRDKLNIAWEGGDIQIMKQLMNAELNIQPSDKVKDEIEVVIIGAPK